MAKDFHDPSVFTDNVSALDLFNNSVRKSFNYDALTGPTYFAKVLSTPLPLNADQMASMLNLDPKVSKTAVDAATKANQKRVTSFYFKGRIEQLHGQFLDDPCDLSTATCPHAIKRLISDHTEFISEGINSEIPAVGDIVRVQLKPASNGPYDLQSGAYLGPTRTWSSRSTAPGAGQSEQCYSAVDNFDEENASTMGDVIFPEADAKFENPAIQGDYKVTSLFTPPGSNCRVIQGVCKKHNGMDLSAARGAPVLSIGDGTVADFRDACNRRLKSDGSADKDIYDDAGQKHPDAACGGGGGNRIRIKHAAGQLADHDVWTVYMHLDNMTPLFKVGDSVKKGQVIGYVGNSGGSAGFHLHIEAHLSSNWKIKADPLTYMNLRPGSSTGAIASAGVDSGNQRDVDTEETAT